MQKAIRIIAVVLVMGFVGYLIVAGAISNDKSQKEPWVKEMTLGNRETADHVFYDYTDIMCPFCNKFALGVDEHFDEFKDEYIVGQNVYYELRLTDLLAKFHPESPTIVENSHQSARAGYCAAEKDKFWEWYGWILKKLRADYYVNDIGTEPGKQSIPELGKDYFTAVGEDIEGLDAEFMKECIESEKTIAKVDKYTKKAMNIVKGGLPYYAFGNYVATGFSGNWNPDNDWQQARLLLNAGIASKKK